MTKVLHLSHHYGCLKDHQYVCDKLGLDLTNKLSIWNDIIKRDVYLITKAIADSTWKEHKDYFNSFDFIITSDTAPLSRIFLENIDEFKGQLIVWVCNRFNYEMHDDVGYHNLMNESVGKDNVKIIPYTKFESMWAEAYKVNLTEDVIRPIGVSIDKPLSESEDLNLIGFGGDYGDELKGGDVLVSRYHNDTLWQDSVKMMEHFNLSADPCKYRGYKGLVELAKKYEAYFILPEQYSKFAAFELMNIGLPVILPSEEFLLHLSSAKNHSTGNNYWFGSGLYKDTTNVCEWYNEYYDQFALYIDDFEDIPETFKIVKEHKKKIRGIMKKCAKEHQSKTLDQWRKIYNV